jgi:uncharacterized protein (UPF0262 family)
MIPRRSLFDGLKRRYMLLIASGFGLVAALLVFAFSPRDADVGQRMVLSLVSFFAIVLPSYFLIQGFIGQGWDFDRVSRQSLPSTLDAANVSARIAFAVSVVSAATGFLQHMIWLDAVTAFIFTFVPTLALGFLILGVIARRARQLHSPMQ